MINHLNSLLIEGVLVDDPQIVARVNEILEVRFTIENDYFYLSGDGERKKDALVLPVQVWGELAEKCLEKLRKGMTARCVGKLKPGMELLAKHVEYKARKSDKLKIVEAQEEDW